MEFRNGINKVYTPYPGTQPVANIIFIHGLFGGPWKTFATITKDDTTNQNSSVNCIASSRRSKTSRIIYWPRDLLPNSIQNINVFSFGYDASVERFMSAAGSNTVHHHGRNLLNSLSDLLKEHSALPLFIVVHSLGGLVVKEALNQSAQSFDIERSSVLQMTRGVIFLGTPHRGSSAATYGRVVFRLTKIFALQNANISLISSLERNSDTLERISTTFVDTLAKAKDLKLWSFAEEKQIRWGLVGMHIVPPESAKIGHERENWGTISGDHRQIAKYSKATDEGFVKVSNVLKGWIDEILFTVTTEDRHLYEDCLKSLNDPEARLRIGEVSQASRVNKGSFEWLFTKRVAYAEWLADDGSIYDPIFWITGKPGSGKSTLMRFALEDPRSESLLPPSIGHPMAYFFHLRGKSLVQKSLQGMMQEILYRILKQFPEFFVLLKPIYERTVSKTSFEVKWDLDDLIEGFSLIPDLTASSMKGRPRIFLFIDALDENQEQKYNEKLVRVLEDIVSKYRVRNARPGAPLLKICLASRPWPLFRSAFGGTPRIPSFAVNDYTEADIKAYTKSLLLKPLSGTEYPEHYQQSVLSLAERITDLAQGVFVWVRVVVDSLCQHIVDGTPVNLLDDIVRRYPSELDELYEYTIRRIPKEYQKETEVALKVVQQSRVQLKLRALYSICQICTGNTSYHIEHLGDPASWLASRGGGLIETTSHMEDRAHQRDDEVQFIHQTVQDFVRQGIKGLSEERSTDPSLSISGSQFLAFTCRFRPLYPHLQPVYKDVFHYLRDIEQAMDLVSPAQRITQFNETRHIQDAVNLRAHRPSEYDDIFKGSPTPYTDHLPMFDWAVTINPHTTPGDDEKEYLEKYMPILQDLYYFATDFVLPIPRSDLEQSTFLRSIAVAVAVANCCLVAALGPRLSTSRTDRPRMLRKILLFTEAEVDMDVNFYDPTLKYLMCKFVPCLDFDHDSLGLATLLVSAIPNEHIDGQALLQMTEILLSSGVSIPELISKQVRLIGLPYMSLLNFVVRFKEDRREAWISLLRRYGASLSDEEFTWTNQIALSASLSDRNLTVNKISGEERDCTPSAIVIIGLGFAHGVFGNLGLARACFAVPRNGGSEEFSEAGQS
ncbi:hypothetical protein F5Y12DRAFT_714855 [Xylaria sp. FL1777]|nr:hypothetical protein F5Y12DRAFT_714855 [Xylaria sp. FL1777]